MATKTLSKNNQPTELSLSFFACPNQNCTDFNKFNASNLSIAERMGKDKAIRRLYCKTCGTRFSNRQGSLMASTKLPEEVVNKINKAHTCLFFTSLQYTTAVSSIIPFTNLFTSHIHTAVGGSCCRPADS